MTYGTEQPGFTLRAALVGAGLALFLLMSSLYIALKLGALPWPIIFSVVFAGGLLRVLSPSGSTNIHEINTAQAGASIGGLVAAGVAFTVPGILYLNQTRGLAVAWPNPWLLGLLTALAGLLGVLLSMPLKYTFVDEEQLPYPAGTAGAELLKLGKAGGKQLFFVMIVGCLAALFALARDVLFPAGFTVAALASVGVFLTFYPMPLGLGAGYILGPHAGFSWFLGAAIGWFAVVPWLFHSGMAERSARAFVQNLGMGLVLGAGLGFFVTYITPRIKAIFAPILRLPGRFFRWLPAVAGLAFLGLLVSGVPGLAAGLALLGVWVMVTIAARMTGETNIDPLEQFGILVGLLVTLVYATLQLEISMQALFMVVTFVSVATAIAGDAGHDYKSAALIGTRFLDVVKADLVAVVVAGLTAPFALELIRSGFGRILFTPAMPAPQAQMVAGSIFGFEHPMAFVAGFGLAFCAEIAFRFLPARFKHKLLLMPLGIGLFLGFGFAIPLALGAGLRALVDRKRPDLYQAGLLVAAGIMGGEGIAGFCAGAFTALDLSYTNAALLLILVFTALLLISIRAFWLARRAVRMPPG